MMSSSSNDRSTEHGHTNRLAGLHHSHSNSRDYGVATSSDTQDRPYSHHFPSANMLFHAPELRPEVLEPPGRRMAHHSHGTTLPPFHEMFTGLSGRDSDRAPPPPPHEFARSNISAASAYTSPPPSASGEHRGSYRSLHSVAPRPSSQGNSHRPESPVLSHPSAHATSRTHTTAQAEPIPNHSDERGPHVNATAPRPKASFKRFKSDPEDDRSTEDNGSPNVHQAERPRSSMSGRSSSHARWLGERETIHGRYHFYDDGSFCPAYIAGEAVNPEWGITKAGKPRKRLARACQNCREKKIKCEPGTAACSQCLKLGKECSRSQDEDDSADSGSRSPPLRGPNASYLSYNMASGYLTPASALSRSHEWAAHIPNEESGASNGRGQKRQRSPSTEANPIDNATETKSVPNLTSPVPRHPQPGSVDDSMFNSRIDPYFANPSLTMNLLEKYFLYRDTRITKILPRRPFMRWVTECRAKSDDDIMLLYTMIALASLFEEQPELKNIGRKLASIATEMESRQSNSMTLQLAQTRLLLTLYHHAKGPSSAATAYDFTARAFRALNALGFSTEAGVTRIGDSPNGDRVAYCGLSRAQLIESRRRTFWNGYLMDRYSGFGAGKPALIHNEDAQVRLPNEESDFENDVESVGPMFDPEEPGTCSEHGREPGAMALLIGVGSVWGDVCKFTYESTHRPFLPNYQEHYDQHYNKIMLKLNHWCLHLPSHLKRSNDNTRAAIRGQYFLTYFTIHALYCITVMKLNRFVRLDAIDHQTIVRNIRRAHWHARALLEIVRHVNQFASGRRSDDVENAISRPFPGFAILTACDIISSAGTADAVPSLQNHLTNAKFVITAMSRYFQSAKDQRKAIEDREVAFASNKYEGMDMRFWRMAKSMETSPVPIDHDLLYGVSKQTLVEALAELDPPSGGGPGVDNHGS